MLNITLSSYKGDAFFRIIGPDKREFFIDKSTPQKSWLGKLPAAGDYTILCKSPDEYRRFSLRVEFLPDSNEAFRGYKNGETLLVASRYPISISLLSDSYSKKSIQFAGAGVTVKRARPFMEHENEETVLIDDLEAEIEDDETGTSVLWQRTYAFLGSGLVTLTVKGSKPKVDPYSLHIYVVSSEKDVDLAPVNLLIESLLRSSGGIGRIPERVVIMDGLLRRKAEAIVQFRNFLAGDYPEDMNYIAREFFKRLGSEGEVELKKMAAADKKIAVRAWAASALLSEDPKNAKEMIPVLVQSLSDPENPVDVIGTLLKVSTAAVPALRQVLQNALGPHPDPKSIIARPAVLYVLRKTGPAAKESVPALAKTLEDDSPSIAAEAALALVAIDSGTLTAGQIKAFRNFLAENKPETFDLIRRIDSAGLTADERRQFREIVAENNPEMFQTMRGVALCLAQFGINIPETIPIYKEILSKEATSEHDRHRILMAALVIEADPRDAIAINELLHWSGWPVADPKDRGAAFAALVKIGVPVVPTLLFSAHSYQQKPNGVPKFSKSAADVIAAIGPNAVSPLLDSCSTMDPSLFPDLIKVVERIDSSRVPEAKERFTMYQMLKTPEGREWVKSTEQFKRRLWELRVGGSYFSGLILFSLGIVILRGIPIFDRLIPLSFWQNKRRVRTVGIILMLCSLIPFYLQL